MLKNIVVGMSGGLDSAVTALLLKNKGFNVTGLFMKNWDITDELGICRAEEDYEDAKWVCDKLKIPLVQVNFVKEYWNHVFSDLLEKYQAGCTPNPDILCNKHIKFDKFYDLAKEQFKADAIATGHYVRTSFGPYLENFQPNTNVKLLKAHDQNKDQTFFLCQVPQKSLRNCMFPLGNYLKTNVRQIAAEAGLDLVVKKRESVGICFIGKRPFQEFIAEYIDNKPGDFVDWDTGKVVGKHQGIHHWTVGQRCKLAGESDAFFVYHKHMDENIIVVVKGTEHPALFTDLVVAEKPYWITSESEQLLNNHNLLNCDFRFQHRKPLVPCKVYKTLTDKLVVRLDVPLRALTKGQYTVFYSGEECLGAAEISYPGPSYDLLNQQINSEHHSVALRM